MKKVTLIFILSMAIAAFANAQATRTWVSGVGDDVNPCSRTAPCKTFAGAISKTASPGIINCLDPGGFGAVTITKSITIDCTATLGSTLSSGVQGIVINAQPTDKIVLRNVDINGAGVTLGTNGINIVQAASVSVYRCKIANYSGDGILVSASSNIIGVFVSGSEILNNSIGVHVNNTGSSVVKLDMDDTTVQGNSNIGIDVAGVSDSVIVTRSNIARNANAQFQVDQSTSFCVLESSTFGAGSTGIQTVSGATVRLSRDMVTGNTVNGIAGAGSTICFSNNVISGNLGNEACSSPGQGQQ